MYPVFYYALSSNPASTVFCLTAALSVAFSDIFDDFNAYGYKRLTAFFLVIRRKKPIGSLLIVYVQYLKVYPVWIFSVQRLLISRIVL